jgi:hypothetical protein
MRNDRVLVGLEARIFNMKTEINSKVGYLNTWIEYNLYCSIPRGLKQGMTILYKALFSF